MAALTSLLTAAAVCLLRFLSAIIPAALFLVLLKFCISIPHELFRKMLHTVAFLCTPLVLILAPNWPTAVTALVLFAAVFWPILAWAERFPLVGRLLEQRSQGELKRSLLLLVLGGAALTLVFWGIFDQNWVVSAGIVMWGFGDACAALVGKPYGKHKVKLPLADHKKSWEGTGAMFLAGSLAGLAALCAVYRFPLSRALVLVLPTAALGAWVELCTHNGDDTVTVPAANCIALFLLYHLL